jgi:hypothetical protein
MFCKDCGQGIAPQEEKALSGEVQTVFATLTTGEWVCPVTGDEHVPGVPRRDVQVIVKHGTSETMVRLSLAEAGNFVFSPIIDALDDGDASFDLVESDPERHASLMRWARGLYGVTA